MSRQDEMEAELARFRSIVPFYEHEIARLNRESVKKADDIEFVRDELATLQRIHDRAILDFEIQNKLLLKDVRELQVRLFQVSKNAIETEAGEEMYQMLKTTKSDQLHGLFEQCNERASVSLFMIQIEFLLNTVLNRHESAVLNQPCRQWGRLVEQLRMHDTECLLEEYTELACRREQLDLMPNDFPGHKAVKGPASADCSMTIAKKQTAVLSASQSAAAAAADFPTSQARAARMFGDRLSPSTGDPRRSQAHQSAQVQAFHRNAVQPLLELTATKRFRTHIELHAETAAGDEHLLRSVHVVHPLHSIKLPQRSTVLKVKFVNPMLKNPSRNFGDDDRDFLVEDGVRSGSNVLDWRPDMPDEDEDAADGGGGAASVSGGTRSGTASAGAGRRSPMMAMSSRAASPSPAASPSLAHIEVEERGVAGAPAASAWDEFRSRFGSYVPAMPRKMRIDVCDLHMCRAFHSFHQRALRRYRGRVEMALKSGAETVDTAAFVAMRGTTEAFSHLALQVAMFDALEEVYVYPELVMKVAWELLSALCALAKSHPHVAVYVDCLTGRASPSLGNYMALVNFKLGANWPQPTLREDDPSCAIDSSVVVSLLHMIFPSDCQLLRPEYVPSADPFLEHFMVGTAGMPLTLSTVRRFMHTAILEQADPWGAKMAEVLSFYSHSLQWGELDAHGTFDAVKHLFSTNTVDMRDAVLMHHSWTCGQMGRENRLPIPNAAFIVTDMVCAATHQAAVVMPKDASQS